MDVEGQPNRDDAIRTELVGLLLHANHRELARAVQRLRHHGQLLVDAVTDLLEPDVEDARAHDQPERLESGLLDEEELVDRQVTREEVVLAHLGEPLACVLRQIVELGPQVWLLHHSPLSCASTDATRALVLACSAMASVSRCTH